MTSYCSCSSVWGGAARSLDPIGSVRGTGASGEAAGDLIARPGPAGPVKTLILIVVSSPACRLSPGELDLQLVLALVAELHLHLEVDLVGDAHGDLPSRAVELDRVVLR